MKKFSLSKFLFFSFLILFFLIFNFVYGDTIGQTVIFNIDSEYDYLARKEVEATLKKISQYAYWYISDEYWSEISELERTLFLEKLNELAEEFDSRIYPIETQFWGQEWNPGIDNDSKITILLTKLANQAGGYFDTINEQEKSRVQESNQREMIYLSAQSLINEKAKIFLAHEFQHLIGFNQKENLRKVSEDVWLNEARSEYSPRLLGYDNNFEKSNLRRRILAFQQSPSDPLAEWKNNSSDYGAITLFVYYLVDQYGDKILVDSLKSVKIGIDSLDDALKSNGFSENFSDLFSNWTIANILNDSSLGGKFYYKFPSLKNFRISPTRSFTLSGIDTIFSISENIKDWQPFWYEFNTPVYSGSNLNLKLEFSADNNSKFRIPYIIFKINGGRELGFFPLNENKGALYVKNFGSDIYKIILIPANHLKRSNFTKNDPSVSFNIKALLTNEFQETTQNQSSSPQNQNLFFQNQEQQIKDISAQIQNLENQLKQLEKIAKEQFPLKRNLFIGSRGEDVNWLQNFLIKENVYPEGKITGYFGNLTRNAVIRFQKKYGIYPQIGYVGEKTKEKIRELLNI